MLETLKQNVDKEKYRKKSTDLRHKEVKTLIFDEFLRISDNKKKGHQNIKMFFGKY